MTYIVSGGALNFTHSSSLTCGLITVEATPGKEPGKERQRRIITKQGFGKAGVKAYFYLQQ